MQAYIHVREDGCYDRTNSRFWTISSFRNYVKLNRYFLCINKGKINLKKDEKNGKGSIKFYKYSSDECK